MSFEVALGAAAAEELAGLPAHVQRQVVKRIVALADDPRPPTSGDLSGDLRGLRKLRVGEYRIVYRVDDDAERVVVRGIGHRSRIYESIARRLS